VRPISISEFKRFNNCRLRWYWSSAPPRGLGLAPRVSLPELSFGRAIHAALQIGYDEQIPFAEAYQRVADENQPPDTLLFREYRKKYYEQVGLGVDVLKHYQTWSEKHDPDYKFLATETKWDSIELPGTEATLSAIIDAVVERNDGLWLLDFKTTTSTTTTWTRQDPQATAYVYAARKLISPDVRGMIFRFLRKKVPGDWKSMILKDGSVTTRKSVAKETTLDTYLRAMGVAVVKDLVEKGLLDYDGEPTLDGYNAALSTLQHDPEFKMCFTFAKGIYREQLESFNKVPDQFIWEVTEYRTDKQIENYMRHFIVPTAKEILNVKWIGPTGLSSAYSHCARCPFKEPCRLAMEGADYRTLLKEEFELSPHYQEELEDEDSD